MLYYYRNMEARFIIFCGKIYKMWLVPDFFSPLIGSDDDEWVSQWVSDDDEWMRVSEWWRWMNEWVMMMNEWVCVMMNEDDVWVSEWGKKVNDEWVSEGRRWMMNEWVSDEDERVRDEDEWVSEWWRWMSEGWRWVSEWGSKIFICCSFSICQHAIRIKNIQSFVFHCPHIEIIHCHNHINI